MKQLLLLTLSLTLLGLFSPSTASAAVADGKKSKLIAKYDTNKNGKIDGEEMEALRKDFAKDPNGDLKAYDTNKNGKLDDDEIAAIKPGAGKKDAKKDPKQEPAKEPTKEPTKELVKEPTKEPVKPKQ